ncbi:MAG: type II secretion system minor pseudopilin [Planctomycetota bacterium]
MRLKRAEMRREGFVIVVVLCMVITLEVLLLGFNGKSRADLRAADDFVRSGQALNCARAGLNIAVAAIRTGADVHAHEILRNLYSQGYASEVGDSRGSVTIIDESGKLNVNLLKAPGGRVNRARVEQLLRLIDVLNRRQAEIVPIGYGLAPSIIDWTDGDEQVTHLPFIKQQSAGAESDYYRKLETPYGCKNSPLDTLAELLLVRGVTPEVFSLIRNYVTVYGDGRVNINSAAKLVIESLSEEMDAALAEMIVAHRKSRPFESVAELRNVPGMTDRVYYALETTVAVASPQRYYTVVSQGNVDHIGCTIVAVVKRNTETGSVDVVWYEER